MTSNGRLGKLDTGVPGCILKTEAESIEGKQQKNMARRSREDAEESILRELGGWIVYILLIIGLTYFIITFGRAENKSEWIFHGDNVAKRG